MPLVKKSNNYSLARFSPMHVSRLCLPDEVDSKSTPYPNLFLKYNLIAVSCKSGCKTIVRYRNILFIASIPAARNGRYIRMDSSAGNPGVPLRRSRSQMPEQLQ